MRLPLTAIETDNPIPIGTFCTLPLQAVPVPFAGSPESIRELNTEIIYRPTFLTMFLLATLLPLRREGFQTAMTLTALVPRDVANCWYRANTKREGVSHGNTGLGCFMVGLHLSCRPTERVYDHTPTPADKEHKRKPCDENPYRTKEAGKRIHTNSSILARVFFAFFGEVLGIGLV